MQSEIPVTKQEFQHLRKAFSRLKQEFLQLRKTLKQQKHHDYPLIKTREVRKILRISASTLQAMRNKGTLPFARVGGLLLYDYNDIRKLLLKSKTTKKQTL
ncbi:Helix-turn-helix domain-containing protein [Chitinophaga sp. CF118]|uniref:helix-turn-helix domain-containing protein n=1 Tax=Chitinophaga sp. CF118 TaxID=1884367 RepID=UPI0008E44B4B|nr:helix-turn-helix domain-containing protein [Chitinophaga sp. CF118]SFD83506.1 Helix-turn-helix domain-containing protein [Chitinophaga sp. CF118]